MAQPADHLPINEKTHQEKSSEHDAIEVPVTAQSKTENDNADSPPPPSTPSTPPEFNPGWRFYASFTSLCIINLAAALDATSLSVALPIISHTLHSSAISAFWAGTSFLLSSTVFQPVQSSLSALLGRKPILLFTLALFTLGAILGGVARSMTTLLIGRTIQGIGGGGIISLTEILITDLVPLRERGKWFGWQSLTWAVGSVCGPVVGGAFAQHASWRWIFWVNLPFCGLGFLTLPFCLRQNHPPGQLADKLRGFDWLGAVLLTGATTAFLMPVSWGGVMFPWSSPRTLVPLILGIGGLVTFVFYESLIFRRTMPPHSSSSTDSKTTPLIPLPIFSSRTAVVSYLGTLIHGLILWCLLYYLPLYYSAVQSYTPTIVGLAVFPETFTIAPISIIVGIAVSRTGRYRWSIWSGWSITLIGMALLSKYLNVHTSVPGFVFLNLVVGVGLGLLFTSMNLAVQAEVTERYVGAAAGMYVFVRSMGQAVGIAVGGVVFQSQFEIKLRDSSGVGGGLGNATALAKDASALVQVIRAMPRGSEKREGIVEAYAQALEVVWAVMAGLAGAALLMSLLTKGLSLDAAQESEQVLRESGREGVEGGRMVTTPA
ncbi:MAG: hypothetical protein OHK93_003584 [Ramalina farinacea]|uniref:Major facilitator superfamily (MFS) profile domain-containing protein n=1 Tax=Ramalina farinacea TaxID=258253 RepID=A0AA43QTN2_9LECA|nr:hypothetical protein [Ramalina farinacea]